MVKNDKNNTSISLLLEKQQYHLLAIILLVMILLFLFSLTDFNKGSLLGITTQIWILFAFAIPVMHQVYVMVVWRLELHLSLVSRKLGSLGFSLYSFLFMILFLSRFLVLFLLAISNADTLMLWDYSIHIILTMIFLLLGVYLVYSVEKYFGIKRALGIDHFDSSYSKNSLVKQGIFKYMDNSMYLVGFLLFYVPGLIFSSLAALLMAFLHHIYIWVHFYFTELPDMKRIYQ
jgi:hypothetical protein